MSDENASKVRVAIHCGYSNLMSEKVANINLNDNIKLNKSLCRQLNNAYAANRRSNKPLQVF